MMARPRLRSWSATGHAGRSHSTRRATPSGASRARVESTERRRGPMAVLANAEEMPRADPPRLAGMDPNASRRAFVTMQRDWRGFDDTSKGLLAAAADGRQEAALAMSLRTRAIWGCLDADLTVIAIPGSTAPTTRDAEAQERLTTRPPPRRIPPPTAAMKRAIGNKARIAAKPLERAPGRLGSSGPTSAVRPAGVPATTSPW